MKKSKKRFSYYLIRVVITVLAIVLLGLVGSAWFVSIKKNELAQRFLNQANTSLVGEIQVQNISLGRLLDYPNISISLNNVTVYEYKTQDTLTDPFIEVEEIITSANINELLDGHYSLPFVKLKGGNLALHRKRNGNIAIGKAFLPINTLGDSSSGKFALFIDTINLIDFTISITDQRFEPDLTVNIDSLRANFSYQKSLIHGLANIHGKTNAIKLDSASSIASAPLSALAYYEVALSQRLVKVNSQKINAFYTDFNFDFGYDYGEKNRMNLDLETMGKGISLKSQSTVDSLDLELANLEGFVGLKMILNWQEDDKKPFLKELNTTLAISGTNIKVNGVDIDNYINKYKRSQNFNLLDVGAIMLAGPAGIAITKGTDYTVLLTTKPGDSSEIKQLVANWKLHDGILQATDLAFNTANNLMAARCNYNMLSDSLDMKILVIDKRGCTMASQGIYGKGSEFKSSRVKVLKTLLGPVTNFFRDIGLGKCDPEYTGALKHPHAKEKKKKKKAAK